MEGQRCASIELFNQSICQRELELMTVFNVMLMSWAGPKIWQIIQTDCFRNTVFAINFATSSSREYSKLIQIHLIFSCLMQESEAKHCIDFTDESDSKWLHSKLGGYLPLPDFGNSFNFWNKKAILALCTASISDGFYEKSL